MNFFQKIFFTSSNWALGFYVSDKFEIKHVKKPSFEIYDIKEFKARGVADPFLFEYNGEIYVFF